MSSLPSRKASAAPPKAIWADREQVPIDADFQRWIWFWRVVNAKELTAFERQSVALFNVFGFLPEDAEGALEEALWFYRCGREPADQAPRERLLDWDADWLLIWADFRVYAGIDLDCVPLHWWRFLALLESLPNDCGIKRKIFLRSTEPEAIQDHRLREQCRRAKAAVALDCEQEDWDAFYAGLA